MTRPRVLALALAALHCACVHAAPTLLANGNLPGSSFTDQPGLSVQMESGRAGNVLRGLGSGPARAGGNPLLGRDLVSTLQANGVDAQHIRPKIEGPSFGADVMRTGVLTSTLHLANDNDFLATDPDTGFDEPNQRFVFGLTDADLGTTHIAQPVPKPSTYAMIFAGMGVLGWVVRRRRR